LASPQTNASTAMLSTSCTWDNLIYDTGMLTPP
jgi:hypothetical protein